MKKITNNEGENISIPIFLYDELQLRFNEGDAFALVNVGGKPHMIDLSENFTY